MDAKEFIIAYDRMCKTSACSDCPLTGEECGLHNGTPDEIAAKVEAWAKANPIRTYKSVLMERFPKACIMQICISEIYGEGVGMCDDDMGANCDECWNRPYEEVTENE